MNNGGGGVAELTEALAEYQAAEQAIADYLEENGNVRDALTDAQGALNDHKTELSDAQLRAAVAQEEADLADAQAALDEVGGLSAANALSAAQAGYIAAVQAGTEAQASLGIEIGAFEFRNEVTLTNKLEDGDEDLSWGDLAVLEPGTVVFTAGENDLIVMGENGQLELADATADFDPAAQTGVDRLLAEAQQTFDAAVAYAGAREVFETAILDMIQVAYPDFTVEAFNGDLNDLYTEETGEDLNFTAVDGQADTAGYAGEAEPNAAGSLLSLYTALETAKTDLADAQQDVETRAELRQDVAEAQAAVDALEALEETRNEARDAIINDEEDGGLGINLASFEDGAATADSDLYVFSDAKGTTIAITNFGAEGEDRIFFGDDYNFVQLEEDQTINNRVGSADELEIFWEETSSGLTLYVEAGAEAGRDLNTDEITTIELAGVTADDVSFAGGFVTVA